MDYLTWNEIIARHFFTPEKAGKEVLLYVNEPLIARLGVPFHAGLAEFVQAVKQGPVWTTRSGFCQKALQAFDGWRSRGFDYPPYVAYLAFFVLEAGREGDFAVHAYYPRLRELLGEPGETGAPASFGRMIDLWDDLEKWSREDKNETLGRFEARIRGGWWKVGLPFSQTLISEDERKHLPVLFSGESFDPSDIPSPEVMLRVLRRSGSTLLVRRTFRLLDSDHQDDTVLRSALVNLVIEELEVEWPDIQRQPGCRRVARSGIESGIAYLLKSSYHKEYKRAYPGVLVMEKVMRNLFQKHDLMRVDFRGSHNDFKSLWGGQPVPRIDVEIRMIEGSERRHG